MSDNSYSGTVVLMKQCAACQFLCVCDRILFCVNCYVLYDDRVFTGLLGNAMQTMGMLDLGGGSTQITFMSSEKVCLLVMITNIAPVQCVKYSIEAFFSINTGVETTQPPGGLMPN